MSLFRALERWGHAIAVGLTLAIGLAVTLMQWDGTRDQIETAGQQHLDFRAAQIHAAVRGRMLDYAQVLRGGVGLIAASREVTRDEWRAYFETLRVEQSYPGIQAFGFALAVAHERKAEHVSAIRREGFPDYEIRPPGERPLYVPIVYVEPFSARNLPAFGFDGYSEPLRAAAMERARDTGDATLSAPVRLLQETARDVREGLLMYVPVYRNGMESHTPAQRRRALGGFVFGAFRVDDLVRGILGIVPDVRLQIYDGPVLDAERLLYDSTRAKPQGEGRYGRITAIDVHDRAWTFRVTSLSPLEDQVDRAPAYLKLFSGSVITLMLAAVVSLLLRQRSRAVAMAGRMTVELRESRERLGLALEGSSLALFDYDVRSGKVHLSDQWNALRGGAPAESTISIEELRALVHPEDLELVTERLVRTLKGESRAYQVEHRVRAHDGSWRWILSRGKVSERDERGRVLRLTGTNADISERKAVEEIKNDFVATVNHELRTPLTALIASLELLKEESGAVPPQAGVFLDMARQNAERLAALVNDILDIEKIEAGRMELNLTPVTLGPVLEEALALNQPYAQRHHARFELSSGLDATIAVRADRDKLMQVLTNLLSNAAKYSPPEGVVTLAATLEDNGIVRISVSDQGPGIPPDFRDRVFEKFARGTTAVDREKSGTGLGLAITKGLIEGMQGTIGYAENTPTGATFYFTLHEAL